MKNQENDYEQLYYDSQYEIRKLKAKIEELETELSLVNNTNKKKIDLRRQILKDFDKYLERRKDVRRNKSN